MRTIPDHLIEGPPSNIAIDPRGRIVLVGTLQGPDPIAFRYQPSGRLDPTFAGDGESDPNFGAEHMYANDIALDGRGRIVIAGVQFEPQSLGRSSNYWFALARLNPNGTPDPSFSEDGFQATHIGVESEIDAIAIDNRNRIIAVGETASNTGYGDQEYVVARYLPSGRLDPSFSGDGVVTGRFGKLPGGPARTVAIDGRGRIVVGGSAIDEFAGAPIARKRFALVRLTDSGHLDKTFGQDGEVKTSVGTDKTVGTDEAGVGGVLIDKRERILAFGNWISGRCGMSGEAAVSRFLPDGHLDRSFSGDGKTVMRNSFSVGSVAIDERGRFVLGGHMEGCAEIAPAIARLRSNGKVDSSFGQEGVSVLHSLGLDGLSALRIDRHDRILIAGTQYPVGLGGTHEFVLQRYWIR